MAEYRIIGVEEFRETRENYPHAKEMLHSLGSIRYCKAEAFRDCILGTLRIPNKSRQRTPQFSFGFYLTKQCLVFIEDTGDLKQWMAKRREVMEDARSTDQLLMRVMEQMLDDDIFYLSHMEKEMEEMEDALAAQTQKDFFAEATKIRQKLSELNAYYEQLTAIGELMEAPIYNFQVTEGELWTRAMGRVERLQNYVYLLREMNLQLRELYQSQQNARQNSVMEILTVVTTLFLPLTLLTGWYGMNFTGMPLLEWRYGYPVVVAVSVLVVAALIWYFKRKKWF